MMIPSSLRSHGLWCATALVMITAVWGNAGAVAPDRLNREAAAPENTEHVAELAEARELNNRALVNESRGDAGKAESLYLHSVRIIERAVGADHPAMAAVLGNLATLYV